MSIGYPFILRMVFLSTTLLTTTNNVITNTRDNIIDNIIKNVINDTHINDTLIIDNETSILHSFTLDQKIYNNLKFNNLTVDPRVILHNSRSDTGNKHRFPKLRHFNHKISHNQRFKVCQDKITYHNLRDFINNYTPPYIASKFNDVMLTKYSLYYSSINSCNKVCLIPFKGNSAYLHYQLPIAHNSKHVKAFIFTKDVKMFYCNQSFFLTNKYLHNN